MLAVSELTELGPQPFKVGWFLTKLIVQKPTQFTSCLSRRFGVNCLFVSNRGPLWAVFLRCHIFSWYLYEVRKRERGVGGCCSPALISIPGCKASFWWARPQCSICEPVLHQRQKTETGTKELQQNMVLCKCYSNNIQQMNKRATCAKCIINPSSRFSSVCMCPSDPAQGRCSSHCSPLSCLLTKYVITVLKQALRLTHLGDCSN